MSIDEACNLYRGFYIADPLGNNAFSYNERRNKRIFVPALIVGTPQELAAGAETVFSELENGVEKNHTGLKNFIYFHTAQKDIFIFDNHNHAFFFWWWAFKNGKLAPGGLLVHIDQHSDMRQPEHLPSFDLHARMDLRPVFDYVNYVLHVGNFIQPALQGGLFSQVKIIDSSGAFNEKPPAKFVLDVDIDIFAPEMSYIDERLKMEVIKEYIQRASLITIASSPFFMDQTKALDIIQEMMQVV